MCSLSIVILYGDRRTVTVVLGMLKSSSGILIFLEDPQTVTIVLGIVEDRPNRNCYYWHIEVFPNFEVPVENGQTDNASYNNNKQQN